MVGVALYVEGGGHKQLNIECRMGFRKFLERAGVDRKMNIVACGNRENAYKRFAGHADSSETAVLLVDSDGPVIAVKAWAYLARSKGMKRPKDAKDEQCHLMVQMMESWFLADVNALASFYGSGFRKHVFPKTANIEEIPKEDVETRLKRATRDTGKGAYHKGRHSFVILAELDPEKVKAASPYADRLIRVLQGS